ncbi:uncharacterized protein KY384_004059 [Bacidia gigantensis]|uniref:uncharacterized protein n=1 Tax=Bacidia gigantensis TaxID=2732470 RepID=UPI001D03C8BA|nr:uncharacterized protein KY384_004059 [Bacidia gigantensis]KAG8530703.1 hypothetical protein KY384_004059 [Bacidia gigantensis]
MSHPSSSASALHTSLLRPPILHILRAAGFTTAKPSALDTLVDLASRYLILLAQRTGVHAEGHAHLPPAYHSHPASQQTTVTITDVRLALQDAGALFPQMSEAEEMVVGREDLRGVEAFVKWFEGAMAGEISRVAGLAKDGGTVPPPGGVGVNGGNAVGLRGGGDANLTKTVTGPAGTGVGAGVGLGVGIGGEAKEDFLVRLKKKYSKTGAGEESRYAGTALGKDLEGRGVRVEGFEGVESLDDWGRWVRGRLYGGAGEGERVRKWMRKGMGKRGGGRVRVVGVR